MAGTKKRILVETAKALAQESGSTEDKSRRMDNLQVLFNLERRVESVAKQKAIDTAKVDAVTYYQDPRTGGITPLNQTETGSLDPQKLRGVLGQDRSLALLLAIANRRTQDEAPKDLDAIIQADLAKAKSR